MSSSVPPSLLKMLQPKKLKRMLLRKMKEKVKVIKEVVELRLTQI